MGKFALGADVGGTHITTALIDLANRSIIHSTVKRAGVNAGGQAAEIIQSWSDCMQHSTGNTDVDCICMAMPGPFDYEKGICQIRGQSKYENLYGLNVKELLAEKLNFNLQAITMENDAACFLQGEVFAGAARAEDKSTVIGITLGTGLGSAVYRNGRSSSADRWDRPFKDSIAEDYLSTRWFVQTWNGIGDQSITGVKELIETGHRKKVTELFNSFADNLSVFLLEFIADEKPSMLVIGGNISKAYDWFKERLASNLRMQHPLIKIETALLGEEAQLLGAVSSGIIQNSIATT